MDEPSLHVRKGYRLLPVVDGNHRQAKLLFLVSLLSTQPSGDCFQLQCGFQAQPTWAKNSSTIRSVHLR